MAVNRKNLPARLGRGAIRGLWSISLGSQTLMHTGMFVFATVRPPVGRPHQFFQSLTRPGEVAQHVVQHTAVFDVFDLHCRIDPTFQRDRLF